MSKDQKYRAKLGARLRAWRAGPCELCGSRELRRELAHVCPTPLAGRGRGLDRRYHDVKKHPYAYARLCTACHGKLDSGALGSVCTRAGLSLGPPDWLS